MYMCTCTQRHIYIYIHVHVHLYFFVVLDLFLMWSIDLWTGKNPSNCEEFLLCCSNQGKVIFVHIHNKHKASLRYLLCTIRHLGEVTDVLSINIIIFVKYKYLSSLQSLTHIIELQYNHVLTL